MRPRVTDALYSWQVSVDSDPVRVALKGVDPRALRCNPRGEGDDGYDTDGPSDELLASKDNHIHWQFDGARVPTLSSPHDGVAGALRSFVLHDGPPFANGPLHAGHFLNRTLKDVFNRYKLQRGYRVRFFPGWDCHGLPIEARALAALEKERAAATAAATAAAAATTSASAAEAETPAPLTPTEVRSLCESYASAAIAAQQADMRAWGILADYPARYLTMHPGYEATQLAMFAVLVQRGLIYRALRPVHWSPSSRSALAEAELEYADVTSVAAHVSFPLAGPLPAPLAAAAAAAGVDAAAGQKVEAVAWTTTPWTLPANRALAYNPEVEYVIVRATPYKGEVSKAETSAEDRFFLVAAARAADFVSALAPPPAPGKSAPAWSSATVASPAPFFGTALAGARYTHPLAGTLSYVAEANARQAAAAAAASPAAAAAMSGGADAGEQLPPGVFPFIAGEHVTSDAGTGLVHTAPGHGAEDHAAAAAPTAAAAAGPGGIEVACPVGEDGCYLPAAGPALAGLSVLDKGNYKALGLLAEAGALLAKERVTHRYPHDWRTKQPIIFRATPQWFCALEELREEAEAALRGVDVVPAAGRARLQAFVAGRKQWCLSRQRSWGTPLPCFYHKETGEPLLTPETVAHVREIVAEEGTQAWWDRPAWALLPEAYRGAQAADGSYPDCPWEQGKDTLDVWLDSGSSWAAVLAPRGIHRPADMYLEGSDQHRGWFQSSLLTSAAACGRAPYRTLLTHGFVVDEEGKKMSKSLGNGVEPNVLINGVASAPALAVPAPGQPLLPLYKAFSAGVGVDALRVWAAAVDSTQDVVLGPTVVTLAVDTVRRWRALTRFILGSLQAGGSSPSATAAGATEEEDVEGVSELTKRKLGIATEGEGEFPLTFNPLTDVPPASAFTLLDRYLLRELSMLSAAATAAYDAHSLTKVFALGRNFMVSTFSSLYADVSKDRLYSEPVSSPSRLACATVLAHTLEVFLKLFAPIAPHLTDDVFARLPASYKTAYAFADPATAPAFTPFSVFAAGWLAPLPASAPVATDEEAARFEALLGVRGAVNKALERARGSAAAAAAPGAPAAGAVAAAAADKGKGKREKKRGKTGAAAAAAAENDDSAAAPAAVVAEAEAPVSEADAAAAAAAAAAAKAAEAAAAARRIRSPLEASITLTILPPAAASAAAAPASADAAATASGSAAASAAAAAAAGAGAGAEALAQLLRESVGLLPELCIVSAVTVNPYTVTQGATDPAAAAEAAEAAEDEISIPSSLLPTGSSGASAGAAALGTVSSVPVRVRVSVRRAPGTKCPRCWRFHTDAPPSSTTTTTAEAAVSFVPSAGAGAGEGALCGRCATVIAGAL